jgi:hypothetical protein
MRSDITDINGLAAIHGFVLDVTCTGDLNDDGDVNQADIAILRSELGQTVTPGTEGDLNGDGIVDHQDLSLLTTQSGSECLEGSGALATLATSASGSPRAVSADGPALPTYSGSERYGATSLLSRFESPAVIAASAAGGAGTGGGGVSGSATLNPATGANAALSVGDRALSVRPLPYRGGLLEVSLAASANLGANPDVAVFDLSGRRIATLFRAGSASSFRWDGRDTGGAPVGAGVYFLRATGAGRTAQLKFAVVR